MKSQVVKALHFSQFLSQLNETGTRWALFDESFNFLHCRPSLPSDISSLKGAAQQVTKALKMTDGDVAFTNLPLITRSHHLDFAVVQKIGGSHFISELILVELVSLDIFSQMSKKDLVIPVPPLHLYQKDQDQTEILESIQEHFPENFRFQIEQAAHRSLMMRFRIQEHQQHFQDLWKKKSIESYFEETRLSLLRQFEDLRIGKKSFELTLGEGTSLSVILEKREDSLYVDFSKSQIHPQWNLNKEDFSDSVVMTLLFFCSFEISINEGFFSLFDLKTPTLKSTQTSRSYSQLQIIPMICESVLRALSSTHIHLLGAMNALGCLAFEFNRLNLNKKSEQPNTLRLVFLGGGGASEIHHGTVGRSPWLKDFSLLSLETLEQRFPFRFISVGAMNHSGGRGLRNGGEGVCWTIEVLEKIEGLWFGLQSDHRALGEHNGRPGLPAGIEVGSEKLNSTPDLSNALHIETGSHLKIITAGGGGFGALPQVEKA